MTLSAYRVVCAAALAGVVGCSSLPPVEVDTRLRDASAGDASVNDGGLLDAASDANALPDASPQDAASDAAPEDAGPACDPLRVPFGGGDGLAGSPYTICSTPHLLSLRTASSSSFLMTADIGLSTDVPFEPIESFEGWLDGAGHTIRGLRLRASGAPADELAFIRSLSGTIKHVRFDDVVVNGRSSLAVVALTLEDETGASVVEDVHVTNASITTTGSNVGGVVGYVGRGAIVSNVSFDGTISSSANYPDGIYGAIAHSVVGTLRQVSSHGTILSTGSAWKTAGIASVAVGGAVLEECASHISIDSNGSRVGGIVSVLSNTAEIRDSYADGTLEANEIVGGIVGEVYVAESAKISRVYVAGPLRAVGTDAATYPARAIIAHPATRPGVTVSSSFFDLTATTITDPGASSGASGRSSGEMTNPATFAAWSSPPWTLVSGSRPRLTFEP